MPLRVLLLRLLLCTSLVVNGLATAFAGAAPVMASPAAALESGVSGMHASHCDHHATCVAHRLDHARVPAHPSGGDGCAGLSCLAHCLGCGQGALPSVSLTWHAPPSIAPEAPRSGHHAPPVIPHLLRPPIG